MERIIHSLEELEVEAKDILNSLQPSDTATLITLSGELGAGKTTLTQLFAKYLGVRESITSPTFVLEKIYELSGSQFEKLIHIDAYRLVSGKDIDVLNFDETLTDPTNLIVLEWPEKVAEALPTPTIAIGLTPHADGSRTMTVVRT